MNTMGENEDLPHGSLDDESLSGSNSMAQDNQGWLDPSLRDPSMRPPSTITNNAMHIVDGNYGQLDVESDDDNGDDDMQHTNGGFPDHPPQTWEMHPPGTSSHPELVENLERSRRQRRPVASKEVVPVMARDKSWLCHSHAFLSESDYGPVWSDSVNLWRDFEQSLPLADLSSVSFHSIPCSFNSCYKLFRIVSLLSKLGRVNSDCGLRSVIFQIHLLSMM